MSKHLARFPAYLALAAAIFGVLASPEALALLPASVANAVSVIAAFIAALTRPVAGPRAAKAPYPVRPFP